MRAIIALWQKAARNMYCDYLRLLDSTWIYGLLSDMQNWAASGCVRFYNSTQFRSPHQIFEGIALWHKQWVCTPKLYILI